MREAGCPPAVWPFLFLLLGYMTGMQVCLVSDIYFPGPLIISSTKSQQEDLECVWGFPRENPGNRKGRKGAKCPPASPWRVPALWPEEGALFHLSQLLPLNKDKRNNENRSLGTRQQCWLMYQSSTQQGFKTTRTQELPTDGKHTRHLTQFGSINHGSGCLLPCLVRGHMMAQPEAHTQNHFM